MEDQNCIYCMIFKKTIQLPTYNVKACFYSGYNSKAFCCELWDELLSSTLLLFWEQLFYWRFLLHYRKSIHWIQSMSTVLYAQALLGNNQHVFFKVSVLQPCFVLLFMYKENGFSRELLYYVPNHPTPAVCCLLQQGQVDLAKAWTASKASRQSMSIDMKMCTQWNIISVKHCNNQNCYLLMSWINFVLYFGESTEETQCS